MGEVKSKLVEMILEIKDKISDANDFAINHNILNSSEILDLSCICDDILGELEDNS